MTQCLFFNKKIKQVLVVYRDHSEGVLEVLKEVKQYFQKNNIEVKVFSQSSLSKASYGDKLKPDLALALGGDGTYLQAVQFVSEDSVPFLGVNMGSFGFLTVYRKQKIQNCLKAVLQGKMQIETRSLIKIQVQKTGQKTRIYSALNDVVLERGGYSRLINISITIQNKNIYSIKADGLILSSPTGSTAYNLASGGPILHPQVQAFAVTPICSHSLTHRPVIVPDNCTMSFQINNQNQQAFLTIDGQKREEINQSHKVILQKSDKTHRTLREKEHNDFLLLKDKLKFSQ